MDRVRKYAKGSQEQVSRNFQAWEFDCPCEDPKCEETWIDSDLLAGIQRMRDALGPVDITNGYRCSGYQEELARRGYETAKRSQHRVGKAADISTGRHTGHQLEACARGCGFKAIGIGAFWIHVDTRSDKERRWYYVKR